jgi:hypothetical protein
LNDKKNYLCAAISEELNFGLIFVSFDAISLENITSLKLQKFIQLRPKKAKYIRKNGFFEPLFFIFLSAAEFTFVLFISVAKN